jgi:nucleotide-binding universal stress UspA family protein
MKRKFALGLLLAISTALVAQAAGQNPRVDGLKRNDGFLPFFWDEKKGELLFEFSPAAMDREFLYFTAMGSGVGSTELFADRSSLGDRSQLCRFRRVGPKVLLIVENSGFRAPNGSLELQRSVEASFPSSVLAAMPIESEQNGTLIVNANSLVVRDAFDLLGQIAHPLKASNGVIAPGTAAPDDPKWRLDADRSVVEMEHTRAFPLNTEAEALLTFVADQPGAKFNQPEARTLTVREHHSFVQLPEAGFEPREADPRVGYFGSEFQDFSQPFNKPLERLLINRWRLQKKNPGAALSEPVKPLVFYLDRAIPEPVRSAARQGALRWNQAFEQAGFKNALVVEDLPEGADPLDVRYPTIQWTNRSGRGWSVGMVQVDPRTGEILHGIVQLDSHRMRTVHNYWDVLQLPSGNAEPDPGIFAELDRADPKLTEEKAMTERLALLACHEMGHVLGLEHNFVASTFGRGSVMDYFAPRVKIRANGTVDMSDAYMQGVGSYDKFAIEWGYSTLGKEDPAAERTRLNAVVGKWNKQGIFWGNYEDPRWNAYDDGSDPVSWLRTVMPMRDALMKLYMPERMRQGEPWSDYASRYALIYLFHRYGLAAAVNVVGSAKIPPSLVGDGNKPFEVWPMEQQREALNLLMQSLDPKELRITPEVWASLVPVENRASGDPERFKSPAGYVFSPQDGARAVSEIVIGGLLTPRRVERLIAIHTEDPAALSAEEVIDSLVKRAFAPGLAGDPLAEVVQGEVAERLMALAADENATPETQAAAMHGVYAVQHAFKAATSSGSSERLAIQIERFLRDPKNNTPKVKSSGAPEGPPV